MSAKRNAGAAKRKPDATAIDRPFDPAVLARAREVAGQYQVVLWFEDGEYYGRGLELPGTMGDGPTPDACVADVREALAATVAYLIERGEAPPPPARERRRTEQVNVRLTVEEKELLEAAARRRGSGGLSDFVREAALTAAGRPA